MYNSVQTQVQFSSNNHKLYKNIIRQSPILFSFKTSNIKGTHSQLYVKERKQFYFQQIDDYNTRVPKSIHVQDYQCKNIESIFGVEICWTPTPPPPPPPPPPPRLSSAHKLYPEATFVTQAWPQICLQVTIAQQIRNV